MKGKSRKRASEIVFRERKPSAVRDIDDYREMLERLEDLAWREK